MTRQSNRLFWASVGVGLLVMGYGVWMFFQHPIQSWPYANKPLVSPLDAQLATIRRFVIILLLHDLVLLPLVFAFGAATFRLLRPAWRAPVRCGLFISAFVLLIAAWGIAAQAIEVQPGNEQVLPNHYPTSVALLLTPVWLAVLIWGWRAGRSADHVSRGALADDANTRESFR